MPSWSIIRHKFLTLSPSIFLRKGVRLLTNKLSDSLLVPFRSPSRTSISNEKFYSISGGDMLNDFSPLWNSPLAVLPGKNWEGLGDLRMSEDCIRMAENAMDHVFDILGSGYTHVDYNLTAANFGGFAYNMAPGKVEVQKQKMKMQSLYRDCAEFIGDNFDKSRFDKYNPIDWHVDFRSGYRFPHNVWYRKLPRVLGRGIDIKIPWSLSRFHHAIPMACYGRETSIFRNEFINQVVDWICANPVRWGVNWACTMEVAIRAVNWLWAVSIFETQKPLPKWFQFVMGKSLYEHGRFISNNLEYSDGHGGNHYIANIIGLLHIAAALPAIVMSDSWLAYALQELESEIINNVGENGSYVEGSTFYQSFVSEMFIHAVALAECISFERREGLLKNTNLRFKKGAGLKDRKCWAFNLEYPEIFSQAFFKKLKSMLRFLDAVRGPDGQLSQFGDNDSSELIIHPGRSVEDLEKGGFLIRLLNEPNISTVSPPQRICNKLLTESTAPDYIYFQEGGIAVYKWSPFFLVIQIGHNIGSYGGHVHSDMLSFQLWVNQHPLFVDPGTYVYGALPDWRNMFRCVEVHNTLFVSEKDPLEMPSDAGGLFVVRQRSVPKVIEAKAGGFEAFFEKYLSNSSYTRRIYHSKGSIVILDVFNGTDSLLNFSMHPSVSVDSVSKHKKDEWVVSLSIGTKKIYWKGKGFKKLDVINSFYSPRYGIKEKSNSIVAHRNKAKSTVKIFFDHSEQLTPGLGK